MNKKEIKKIAEKHYKFWEHWFHIVYVDSFIHGFKHGEQKNENKSKS